MKIDDMRQDQAYAVRGWPGVAWWYWGEETQPDKETEWTGLEVPTGRATMTMIGDDRRFYVSPDLVSPLQDGDFCPSCGQIGCAWGRV